VKRLLAVALMVAVGALIVTVNPATADHDQVFAPCDPADTRPTGEQVWYINYETGDAVRFNDPFWAEQASPLVSWITNWSFQCRLGMTGAWAVIPMEPLSHPPSYVTETRYDLFTAEYEGWPSEQTALLLAERYPPGTPGKYQFPISAAIEFLRAGGKVGGLDFLWNSTP